ncbi:hypothetical protein GCM10023199_10300 [Actinomycetospora chibensis]
MISLWGAGPGADVPAQRVIASPRGGTDATSQNTSSQAPNHRNSGELTLTLSSTPKLAVDSKVKPERGSGG